MKQALLAVTVAVLVGTSFAGKIKDSEWKTGILLSQVSKDGSTISGNAKTGAIVEHEYTETYYRIDAGDMIYVAVREIHFWGDKLLKVTTNTQVKFVIKGDHVYLLDEDGKQHKLDLQEKIAKPK